MISIIELVDDKLMISGKFCAMMKMQHGIDPEFIEDWVNDRNITSDGNFIKLCQIAIIQHNKEVKQNDRKTH